MQGFEGLDVNKLPRCSGRCHIPTSVLTQALELWDMTDGQSPGSEHNGFVLAENENTMPENHFLPRTCAQRKWWYLCHGSRPWRLDEAMLATRTFWFEPPVVYDPEWTTVLDSYARFSGVWPVVPLPTVENYVQAALTSKDSALGPDGIPYAAWRSFPGISAEAMYNFMTDILCSRRPPVSMGVWIPKAKLGPTADYFRPLGMPISSLRD